MLDWNNKSDAVKLIQSMQFTQAEKDHTLKITNALIQKASEAIHTLPPGCNPLVIPAALAAATAYVDGMIKNTTVIDDPNPPDIR